MLVRGCLLLFAVVCSLLLFVVCCCLLFVVCSLLLFVVCCLLVVCGLFLFVVLLACLHPRVCVSQGSDPKPQTLSLYPPACVLYVCPGSASRDRRRARRGCALALCDAPHERLPALLRNLPACSSGQQRPCMPAPKSQLPVPQPQLPCTPSPSTIAPKVNGRPRRHRRLNARCIPSRSPACRVCSAEERERMLSHGGQVSSTPLGLGLGFRVYGLGFRV